MNKTRLLVTGGNGMVGAYVPTAFGDWEVKSTDVDTMNLVQPAQVEHVFRDFRPDVVLHLAAATDVDRCQQEPDWAYAINAIGSQTIALACRKLDALLVYASTGAVFPGDRKTPYSEFDATAPSNTYAASKLAGEGLVRELCDKHLIVRAGWMFGGGSRDKKFVGKLVAQIASGKTALQAVNDKFGTPTYAKDFLAGIRRLIDLRCLGLFHMGNDGCASRYDMAVEICKIVKGVGITLQPVSSGLFKLPAPRANEAIDNYKLRLMKQPPQRPWQKALDDYIASECQALLADAGKA